jgi:hypothetical protein
MKLNTFNLMRISTRTRQSNLASIYFTWEIRARIPVIKDYLSQFPACPLNIKSLTLIVYFLNLCAVYVPDSTKNKKLPSFEHSNFKEVESSYN